MDVESVSREVFEMLEHSQLGFVVAVWADGGVTAHRQLGFRDRPIADGRREAPLTSFVRFSSLPSVYEIQERIERAASQPRHQR
ncbi:MAG: hypothetical protein ACRDG3_10350 [Tepidiformaceae bacterium]